MGCTPQEHRIRVGVFGNNVRSRPKSSDKIKTVKVPDPENQSCDANILKLAVIVIFTILGLLCAGNVAKVQNIGDNLPATASAGSVAAHSTVVSSLLIVFSIISSSLSPEVKFPTIHQLRLVQETDQSNYYPVVLLTYNMEEDRMLEVEHLQNAVPARDFVAFYNGLPGYEDMSGGLNMDTGMIMGVGYVSLDVTRTILSPVDKLRQTDVTEMSVEQQIKSSVRGMVLVGRRWPLKVDVNIKEPRELVKLEGTRPVFCREDNGGVRDQLGHWKSTSLTLSEY